jgi:cytochrome c-type biogenesis protein CcmH
VIRRLIILTALALASASASAAGDYNNIQLPDPRQEAAALALMDTIRCVVCQGQSIADSNADLAAERIAAGEKPETIRAWLIAHYGQWVSFKPQFDEQSAPLWLIPFAAFGIGAFLMRGRFKKVPR